MRDLLGEGGGWGGGAGRDAQPGEGDAGLVRADFVHGHAEAEAERFCMLFMMLVFLLCCGVACEVKCRVRTESAVAFSMFGGDEDGRPDRSEASAGL